MLIAAVTAVVIVLSNRGDELQADPGDDRSGTEQSIGSIRAYPSREFTADPADVQAQQAAEQVATTWVEAINVPDFDLALEYMCERDAGLTETQLLGGIEVGSMRLGSVSVNGKNGMIAITLRTDNGEDIAAGVPMVVEQAEWTVCMS